MHSEVGSCIYSHHDHNANIIAKSKLLELKTMELNAKTTKLENKLGIKENEKIELNNKVIDNKVKIERSDYELRDEIIIFDNEKGLKNHLYFNNESQRHRARQAIFGMSAMFLCSFLFVQMIMNNNNLRALSTIIFRAFTMEADINITPIIPERINMLINTSNVAISIAVTANKGNKLCCKCTKTTINFFVQLVCTTPQETGNKKKKGRYTKPDAIFSFFWSLWL